MKRNLDLIVRSADSYYELFLTKKLKNPQLYYTQTPYQDGSEVLIGSFDENTMTIADPLPGRRIYFIVKSADQPDLVAGTTLLPLAHIENFRDMGGYIGADGRTVKWGLFFRSGALSGLTKEEKQYCEAIPLNHILDYRVEREIKRAPDDVPDCCHYHGVSAFSVFDQQDSLMKDVDMAEQLKSITTLAELDQLMEEFRSLYAYLPFKNPAYEEMFHLLDTKGVPFVQHCSAGKDRTGVGCALLLLALGVDRETVIGDYLLSARYRERLNQAYIEKIKEDIQIPEILSAVDGLLSVRRELIQTSFDAIDKKYGKISFFLEREYGIHTDQIEKWRNLYLN